MSLKAKQILVAVGFLTLIGLGLAISWWRDHQTPIEDTPEPAQSAVEAPKQTEDQAEVEAPQSGAQSATEGIAEAEPVGVCATEGKAVLDYYFSAPTADPEHWREGLNAMLSPAGIGEQDLIDQSLILEQKQIGWPAAVDPDPEVGVIYCEGVSDLTGWVLELSRDNTEEPWLVDSIRAYEPTRGYAPPRSITEE